MPLPAPFTLSYNGVEFDSAAKVRASSEYVSDEANRTTIGIRHSLDVEAILAPADDAGVDSLRRALGERGKRLVFVDNAFGSLIVNDSPGGLQDIANGPIPRVLDWRPLGGGIAASVVWKVETTVPACERAGNSPIPIKSLNFTVSHRTGVNGRSTRTIAGHYELPVNRFATGREIGVTADEHREAILSRFIIPEGFERESSFDLSADKARVEFRLTDNELDTEHPLPPNVVAIRAAHTSGWSRREMAKNRSRLTASITMRPGHGFIDAMKVFDRLATERWRKAVAGAAKLTGGGMVLPEAIDMSEDVFGSTHNFSVDFRVTGSVKGAITGPASMLVESTGIGSGTPWPTWSPWTLTMQAEERSPQSLRGHRGLVWRGDRIVDLCDGSPTKQFAATPGYEPPTQTGGDTVADRASSVFRAKCPKKNASWLAYQHWYALQGGEEKAVQLAIEKVKEPGDKWSPGEDLDDVVSKASALRSVKVTGSGVSIVYLVGWGERACHPPPQVPEKIEWKEGKTTMHLLGKEINVKSKKTATGMTIYRFAFVGKYVTNRQLDRVPEPVSFGV